MPALRDEIDRPVLIVCEGPDDARFLRMMLTHLGISTIWIEYVEGESQFRSYVRGLRGRAGFRLLRSLAIVRDADMDSRTKFSHACSQLRDFGYPIPTLPLQLATGRFPALAPDSEGFAGSTGVMILPPDKSVGALEALCLEAIAGDPSLPCVDQFLECAAQNAGISWPEQYRSKARLNVWLGSRPDPRRRLREALTAGTFPMSHEAFGPIRDFLTRLAAAADVSVSPDV